MKDIAPIGFFDSGIGGLSVLSEAMSLMPNEDFIYYADTENVPYGLKNRDEVRGCVLDAVSFMVDRGIKALVVACNTATSVAVNDLRGIYDIPIVGMEPAIKPAVIKNRGTGSRVLALATPLTLAEEKFKRLVERIDNENIVDWIALPELVNYAENFAFDNEPACSYLRKKLQGCGLGLYGSVVLGCTHFIYYKRHLGAILPSGVDLVDGNAATARHLKKTIDEYGLPGGGSGSVAIYSSANDITESTIGQKYIQLMRFFNSALNRSIKR